jgi:hypothetical protein
LDWWSSQSKAFELYISDEVIRELSDPNFPDAVRAPALAMLSGLNALPLTSEVASLAQVFVRERVMPSPSVLGDAVHVAVAAVHRMDYLLTWNQKHLANPNKRAHLAAICFKHDLPCPQIVTPDLLIVENEDE